MIAGESEVAARLDDGDYYEALGLSMDATAMEIHVASARRAAEMPDLALRINAIGAVLRDETQRAVYLIARQERDAIVSRAMEPQLRMAVPDLRKSVWDELQRLLRCDFDLPEVKIGPRGARSLASRHEWVREAVINSAFPVLRPTPAERRDGAAYRRVSRVTACASCGGTLAEGCDCNDTFSFSIPTGAAPGTLLGAYGERTGRYEYMILDSAVVTPRPENALRAVYVHWVLPNDARQDLTVEEAEGFARRSVLVGLIGYPVAGGLLGLLLGSWAAGVLTGLAGYGLAVMLTRSRWSQRGRRRYPALLVLQLGAGALAGYATGDMTSGLVVGAVLSVLTTLLMLVGRSIRT